MSATTEKNPVTTTTTSEDMSCKVFVGNLSYQTRESEVQEIFSKSGTVVNVKIISYHNRSKGYCFVTMGSEKEAQKAVDDLKGLEFDGRAMNVERVTPQEAREKSESDAINTNERSSKPRRGARRGSRGSRGGNLRTSSNRSSVISKTVIYIGNLPYSATEEDLKTIFAGYNVVNANIVRRSNGTSKGYGFVYVESEKDQTRALLDLVNVECDDRPLHIKAAHSEEPYEERKKSSDIEAIETLTEEVAEVYIAA